MNLFPPTLFLSHNPENKNDSRVGEEEDEGGGEQKVSEEGGHFTCSVRNKVKTQGEATV